MGYTIGDVAKITGMSSYTLRYYDKKGLLPFIDRDPSGRRHFKEHDFEFLQTINCLKNTGMSLKEIKQFIELCQKGDCTLNERLAFFNKHRKDVEKQLQEVQGYLDMVDHKIYYYTRACEAGTEDGIEC